MSRPLASGRSLGLGGSEEEAGTSCEARATVAQRRVPRATGFVGAHAIAWAASHPADKDLPWLLYVAVQSSRGGCVDADRTAISKKAWQILHRRFPDSMWADQAPYFY